MYLQPEEAFVYAIVFAIALLASAVGAICGIGGGIIIKPVMDAVGVADVATINFISGCTVLSMTLYSVLRSRISGTSQLNPKTDTPLAIGAAAGGLLGKQLFSAVAALMESANLAGAVQSGTLFVITLGTLVYTINKERVTTRHDDNLVVCLLIGLVLGVSSSFLGIGGGPINLVVLFYFFSMTTKRAAQSSLYIILLSQTTSTASALLTQDLSGVAVPMLAGMVVCGIAGGMIGRKVNSRIDDMVVDKLFIGLMVVIMCINVFNVWKYALT